MTRQRRLLPVVPASALAVALASAAPPSQAEFDVALDEFFMRIEINATDGDVGLHTKLDGDGWGEMEITNPQGYPIYDLDAMNELQNQGQTENFSESTEPPCFNPGNGEAFQTLAEFLGVFGEGKYVASGRTNDGANTIGADYDLVHDLPAAPDIAYTDGRHFEVEDDDDDGVVLRWMHGNDFGACSTGPDADDGGLDPTDVEVDLWEVTVEPTDDEAVAGAGLPFTVFTVQLPADQRSVTVPREYFLPYLVAGVTNFKFEVGAKAGEHQTFSEGEITAELDD